MSQILEILHEIRSGSQQAAEQLLSLVRSESQSIAAQKMTFEGAGSTL